MTKSQNAIWRAITFGGCCLLAACSTAPTNLSAGRQGSELSGSLVFPSKIALAVLGNNPSESARSNIARREETWRKDVVEACSKLPQCGQHQTEKQVERRLSCLFKRPSGHSDLSLNGPAPKELIRLAVQKAAEETGPITPEQTQKAVELIRTGEFSRDIAQSVDTVLARINPSLPSKVIRELPRNVLNSPAVVNGAARDLSASLDGARNCLSNIVSMKKLTGTCGNAGHTPTPLRNTLKQVYSITVAKDAADTLSALIATDNETTRLAIIVYARANGIRISEDDLDTLRESLLNTDNPDLGPLVHKGLESMRKQYGLEEAERRFKTMNNVGSCE